MQSPLDAEVTNPLTGKPAPENSFYKAELIGRRVAGIAASAIRNGDVVEGTLTGIKDAVVRVEADGKKVEIERDKVAAVTLSTELAYLPKPKGVYGRGKGRR